MSTKKNNLIDAAVENAFQTVFAQAHEKSETKQPQALSKETLAKYRQSALEKWDTVVAQEIMKEFGEQKKSTP